MPPKRKSTYTTGGTAKKTKKSTGTTTKKSSGYGGSKIDWDAVAKLADATAKKQVQKEINKNIETQNSEAMVVMTHTTDHTNTTGFDLGGLNFDAANQKFAPDQAMIFNLGYLSAQGTA